MREREGTGIGSNQSDRKKIAANMFIYACITSVFILMFVPFYVVRRLVASKCDDLAPLLAEYRESYSWKHDTHEFSTANDRDGDGNSDSNSDVDGNSDSGSECEYECRESENVGHWTWVHTTHLRRSVYSIQTLHNYWEMTSSFSSILEPINTLVGPTHSVNYDDEIEFDANYWYSYIAHLLRLRKGDLCIDVGANASAMVEIALVKKVNVEGVTDWWPHITEFECDDWPHRMKTFYRDCSVKMKKGKLTSISSMYKQVDAAYSIHLSHHLGYTDRNLFLSSIHRALKTGGRFVNVSWALTSHFDPLNHVHQYLAKSIEIAFCIPKLQHKNFLCMEATAAGFKLLQCADLMASINCKWGEAVQPSPLDSVTTRALSLLQVFGFVGEGNCDVHELLVDGIRDLGEAARLRIITPAFCMTLEKSANGE